MTIAVHVADSDAELERVSGVLMELRNGLNKDELIARIKEQQRQGYQIVYAEADGVVAGVAGFIVGSKLAWGKHIYVDDLVTSEDFRSSGIGSRLIDWLKSYAREQSCKEIHLDSGVQRFAAHRFYLRHGFNIASHHFSIAELADC